MHSGVQCLQKLPIFGQLSTDALKTLNEIAHHRKFYPKGSLIVTPDSRPGLVEIDEGKAKVYTLAENGNEKILYLLPSGSIEGEHNLFATKPVPKFIEALEDSWVCSIDTQAFQDFLKNTPAVSLEMINILGSRLLELELSNSRRDLLNAKERILAYLTDWQNQTTADWFKLPLKKGEFASILGISPETLSRNLKQLVSEEKIEMHGANFRVIG